MVKAAVLYEQKSPLVVEDVELDDPKAGEVLVKIGAAGVCRSDRHYMHGDAPTLLPVVLGHEGAGTVEAVGPGVTSVRPGQQVILSFVSSCGRCKSCITGNSHLCDTHAAAGAFMFDGTTRLHKGDTRIHHFGKTACFAEYSVMPEAAVVPIDSNIGMDIAALIGCCVPTGVGAVISSANVQPGSTVAVIGCGGVGLNAIQGARLAGALRIIAIDAVEDKLTLAREFGATDVIDASGGDVEKKVKDLTGGGVDYSFEAIGKKETAELSFEILRAGGTATIIGMIPLGTKIELDGYAFLRERRIQGSSMGSNHFRVDMPRYIDFYLQGRLKLDELVTKRLKLEDINDAFKFMKEGSVARSVMMFD